MQNTWNIPSSFVKMVHFGWHLTKFRQCLAMNLQIFSQNHTWLSQNYWNNTRYENTRVSLFLMQNAQHGKGNESLQCCNTNRFRIWQLASAISRWVDNISRSCQKFLRRMATYGVKGPEERQSEKYGSSNWQPSILKARWLNHNRKLWLTWKKFTKQAMQIKQKCDQYDNGPFHGDVCDQNLRIFHF